MFMNQNDNFIFGYKKSLLSKLFPDELEPVNIIPNWIPLVNFSYAESSTITSKCTKIIHKKYQLSQNSNTMIFIIITNVLVAEFFREHKCNIPLKMEFNVNWLPFFI